MTPKLSYLFIFLTITFSTTGQDTTDQSLFKNGIYIENLGITIPWSTDYKNIVSVGNPKVDNSRKSFTRFTWDSVRILNGVSVNLSLTISRRTMKTNKSLQLITFHGRINVSDFPKIARYLNDYTNNKSSDHQPTNSGGWKINGTMIKSGIHKRQSDLGFFDIQKVFPK